MAVMEMITMVKICSQFGCMVFRQKRNADSNPAPPKKYPKCINLSNCGISIPVLTGIGPEESFHSVVNQIRKKHIHSTE